MKHILHVTNCQLQLWDNKKCRHHLAIQMANTIDSYRLLQTLCSETISFVILVSFSSFSHLLARRRDEVVRENCSTSTAARNNNSWRRDLMQEYFIFVRGKVIGNRFTCRQYELGEHSRRKRLEIRRKKRPNDTVHPKKCKHSFLHINYI